MRLWLVGLTAALLSTSAYTQSTSAPEIPFESVPNFVKLPPDTAALPAKPLLGVAGATIAEFWA